ncbi:preprotein translocase subunit SecG [Methylohalobius crimeensis]|uniref:preprotein translocase subunit SecG n=1 Tax=Methylohalobius crimeensis TaxID=244365 RepID=UPI0003B64D7C|nr:preprotein translocase subunit SecG [Methylohalobius crimeensis]
MYQLIIVVHVLIAIGIVVLVLLQQGKGADMGAAFGSGASGTLFGARGSTSFLSRTTAILAALFFLTSLSIAYFSDFQTKKKDVMDILKQESDVPTLGTEAPQSKQSDMPVVAPSETPESSE